MVLDSEPLVLKFWFFWFFWFSRGFSLSIGLVILVSLVFLVFPMVFQVPVVSALGFLWFVWFSQGFLRPQWFSQWFLLPQRPPSQAASHLSLEPSIIPRWSHPSDVWGWGFTSPALIFIICWKIVGMALAGSCHFGFFVFVSFPDGL